MSNLQFREIADELKKRKFRPIYFLCGDEPYFIDRITAYLQENVLSDAEKSFNLTQLYGRDTNAEAIMTTARKFPMMAEFQVVIVKEAQYISDLENLAIYAEHPLKSTILVINYKNKTLDKRRKLYNTIQRNNGIVFESKKLYEAKLPGWITGYLKGKGFSIDMNACMMLVEFLGSDLGKISNELEKLIITLPEREKVITGADVERNIGISKDYNNFELNKALGSKDVLKANRIINYFGKNQKDHHITVTLSMLYFLFSKTLVFHLIENKSRKNAASVLKVNPYFVSDYEMAARNYSKRKVVDIISLLREYDLKSKGFGNVQAGAGDLLKELVYKILH